ncbi:MAG: response regulator transcription factor [Eubacterium sp.]|nr:response regulator transcription factor [Eubacterium sp.]
MYQILLAEDEDTLRSILKVFFEKNGFDIDTVDNGDDACLYADRKKYDIVILDIMMPGRDGKEVCRYIRNKYDVPVIFLTALGSEKDIVSGYEIGADEYVTKPFSTTILHAKVNALIKRYHGLLVKDGKIKMDEILIDPARRYVTVDGKAVNLAPKEYDLLMCFLDNREIVLSRERILDIVWGMDYDGYDRAVDTHIKKLRKVLGKASHHIETVIKSGYVWK